MNIIKQIFNHLKTTEKNMLIQKSGSTKDSKCEKIRSGQSYLYKKSGMESEIIEVRFCKNVRGDCLSRALSESMKRYPYLNTKLIEKDGDFYIVQNENALVVKKTQKLAKLGGIACNYHLIDITYYGKSIFISFHHALCDGRGIKPFVETMIWYYCNFRFNSTKKVEGIRLAEDKLLQGETKDPFLQKYSYDENKQFINLSREAFKLPYEEELDNLNYRFELEIKHDDFMRLCKTYNATPVIMTSILMSSAIAKLYSNFKDRINANIAVDIRSALGAENTFKNCVKSMILPYEKDFQNLSPKEQGTKLREILSAQRDVDYCKRETSVMLGLFDKLDTLPTYEEKQKIMSFFDSMSINSYVISYLGQFLLGVNEKYIDSIHLYNSGTAGLGINMISTSNKFIFDFKQSFKSDEYVNAFCLNLTNLDIEFTLSEAICFETPHDNLLKRK